MTLLFGRRASEGVDVQRPGGGWLNVVVLPDASGLGSTIEIKADLDAEMYTAVRSVGAQPLRHDRPGLGSDGSLTGTGLRLATEPETPSGEPPTVRTLDQHLEPSGPVAERQRRLGHSRDLVERCLDRFHDRQVRDDHLECPLVRWEVGESGVDRLGEPIERLGRVRGQVDDGRESADPGESHVERLVLGRDPRESVADRRVKVVAPG